MAADLEGVAELTAKQAAILHAAAGLLRSVNVLVYATCSLLREENEGDCVGLPGGASGIRVGTGG